MNSKIKRNAIVLVVLIVVAFICMTVANSIQTNNGQIRIEEGYIDGKVDNVPSGKIFYKLYIPDNATEETPAPGVLLLHGYQNDHETCAAYASQLPRLKEVGACENELG